MKIIITILVIVLYFLSACSQTNNSEQIEANQPLQTVEENEKLVDLSQHGFNFSLTCILPNNIEVNKKYDEYSIDLSPRVSIETITYHPINYYNLNTKTNEVRTVKQLIEEAKVIENRSELWKEYIMEKEEEDGFVAYKKHLSGKKIYWFNYFLESDENIYEIVCAPIIPYTKEEYDLVYKTIKSFRVIPTCYALPKKIASTDSLLDLRDLGYALQLALPKNTQVEATKMAQRASFNTPINGNIEYTHYEFYHDVNNKIIEQKKAIQEKEGFIKFIHNDKEGYLAAFDPTINNDHPYEMWHIHRSNAGAHEFKVYFPRFEKNKKLARPSLKIAEATYNYIRNAVAGKRCSME